MLPLSKNIISYEEENYFTPTLKSLQENNDMEPIIEETSSDEELDLAEEMGSDEETGSDEELDLVEKTGSDEETGSDKETGSDEESIMINTYSGYDSMGYSSKLIDIHKIKYPIQKEVQNINTIDYDNISNINLAIYKINDTSIKSFLEFLLYKFKDSGLSNSDLENTILRNKLPKKIDELNYTYNLNTIENTLIFPRLELNKDISLEENIIAFFEDIFYKDTDDKLDKKKYIIDGYIVYDNEPVIFININNIAKDFEKNYIDFKKKNDEWWWCTISEILNTGHIFNFPIHKSVTTFFLNNPNTYTLYESTNNKSIEIPIVAYIGDNYKKGLFRATLGSTRSMRANSHFGPYYYSTTFQKAVSYAGWNDNNIKNNKGLIIRYIIFKGLGKIILNNNLNKTIKSEDITDTNGNWTKIYSNITAGRLLLDDNSLFEHEPTITTSLYIQRHRMSYAILDKTYLGEKWDPDGIYSIE